MTLTLFRQYGKELLIFFSGAFGCIQRSVQTATTLVGSRVVLKEPLTIVKVGSALTAITATFLVIQPEFLFGSDGASEAAEMPSIQQIFSLNHFLGKRTFSAISPEHNTVLLNQTIGSNVTTTENPEVSGSDPTDEIFGILITVLCGLSAGSNMVLQKKKFKHVSVFLLCFWSAVSGAATSFICTAIFDSFTFPTISTDIILFISQALSGSVATLFILCSVANTSPVLCSLALTLQLFFLLILQYTALQDIMPGNQNWIEVLGVILVILAAIAPPIWNVVTTKYSHVLEKCNCTNKIYSISDSNNTAKEEKY